MSFTSSCAAQTYTHTPIFTAVVRRRANLFASVSVCIKKQQHKVQCASQPRFFFHLVHSHNNTLSLTSPISPHIFSLTIIFFTIFFSCVAACVSTRFGEPSLQSQHKLSKHHFISTSAKVKTCFFRLLAECLFLLLLLYVWWTTQKSEEKLAY